MSLFVNETENEQKQTFVRFVDMIYVKIYDILCAMPFMKNLLKKCLTIWSKDGKISKLSSDSATFQTLKNFFKKFQKTLKKVLTKCRGCGIIVKLSARKRISEERSLKIEQQERSTKHCEVRKILDLVKELYILNKVKEAKKEQLERRL